MGAILQFRVVEIRFPPYVIKWRVPFWPPTSILEPHCRKVA